MCAEDHLVLFGISTLRDLCLFVEHPLELIESVKIRPMQRVRRSVTEDIEKLYRK